MSSPRSISLLFLVNCAVLCLGALTAPLATAQTKKEAPPANKVTAAIHTPPDGATVGPGIPLAGSVSGPYRHLWVAVRVGGLLWPKEPRVLPEGGKWKAVVGGAANPPGGVFDIVLIDVPERTSQVIENWIQVGRKDGHFPGLAESSLEEARVVARRTYRY